MPLPLIAALGGAEAATGLFATLGGGIISGLFGSKKSKNEAKQNKELKQMDIDHERWMANYQRQNQLADRRYKEEGVGGYRKFYSGGQVNGQEVKAPEYTQVNNPEAQPQAKPKPLMTTRKFMGWTIPAMQQ
mgnify:CR=1 FL=1